MGLMLLQSLAAFTLNCVNDLLLFIGLSSGACFKIVT
jgi:hypothetical protein